MRQALLLLLGILFVPLCVGAQIGIIVDEDGWTNLRTAPSGKAEVLWRIPEDITFWYDEDAFAAGASWVKVTIPADTLGKAPRTETPDEEVVSGYVHRSRIQDLHDLPPYTGKAFRFKYVLEDFDPTGRELEFLGEKVLLTIDQDHPWGTDGNLPRTAVRSIAVQFEGKDLIVPPGFFTDLFECSNDVQIAQVKNLFFVHQWNSDGAGSYQLTWVFSKRGLERRIILAP